MLCLTFIPGEPGGPITDQCFFSHTADGLPSFKFQKLKDYVDHNRTGTPGDH